MLALRDALRDLPEAVFADLLESEGAYLLQIDLPGATTETVDVSATPDRIQIEARRTKTVPDGFQYISEQRSLFLDVELPVPHRASATEMQASMERGVLTLQIPKRSATTETAIPVEER